MSNEPTVRFFALDRDEAKRVFAARVPEALRDVLQELWSNADRAARNLEFGQPAVEYEAAIAARASHDPPAQALLTRGGRALPASEGEDIYLLRPDLVAPLSQSPLLGDPGFAALRALFSEAAAIGGAVVIRYGAA